MSAPAQVTARVADPYTSPLHPDRAWIRLARLVVALGLAASLIHDGLLAWRAGELAYHLSYFTVLSNWAICIAFAIGALLPRGRLPVRWDDVRGALTLYLLMTGLIYHLLIAAPLGLWPGDVSWTNNVQHTVVPVLAVADWLMVAMRRPGSRGRPLWWLVPPLLYLAYTLIRGAVVDWYPYAFLDPTGPGGWAHVAIMMPIVLVIFLAGAALIHVAGQARVRLEHRRAAAATGRGRTPAPPGR